jgi:hydroxyacylglutathione hydrolase
LFEGTPEQMATSLAKLAALPDDTLVFCAHEYTMSNLRFAHEVDASNAALSARIELERQKREQGKPTVPSTIGLEKATNPFLRYREPAIVQRLQQESRLQGSDAISAFAALREWKNHFR